MVSIYCDIPASGLGEFSIDHNIDDFMNSMSEIKIIFGEKGLRQIIKDYRSVLINDKAIYICYAYNITALSTLLKDNNIHNVKVTNYTHDKDNHIEPLIPMEWIRYILLSLCMILQLSLIYLVILMIMYMLG